MLTKTFYFSFKKVIKPDPSTIRPVPSRSSGRVPHGAHEPGGAGYGRLHHPGGEICSTGYTGLQKEIYSKIYFYLTLLTPML